MTSASRPRGSASGRIVLAGAGHAHLHLLREARGLVRDGYRVTVVTPGDFWYSGAATGVLAGLYPRELTRVDVGALADAGDVALVRDRVVGADPRGRRVFLASGAALEYDVLSVNVGSVPRRVPRGSEEHAVGVKPIDDLVEVADAVRDARARGGKLDVMVVGGGPSGCEVALAVEARGRREGTAVRVTLLTPSLLPGDFPSGAREALRETLAERGVALREGVAADAVGGDGVSLEGDGVEAAGVVVDATGLVPPAEVRELGLPVDEAGALRVDEHLRSVGDERVFGAGDCVLFEPEPLPRIGVFAVRQAPVLLHNLRAVLEGRPLRTFRPQDRWLLILSLGDGTGLAVRGRLWWRGRLAFLLKDWLDRRFLRRHRVG